MKSEDDKKILLAVREVWVTSSVSKRIKSKGGCRICQKAGAIYAKELLNNGKTAANAIFLGVRAGIDMHNKQTVNRTPIFDRRIVRSTLEA